MDYTSTPITATFTAGTKITTINVPVTNDNIAEQLETFDLDITIPPALSGDVVPGDITTAVGNITDISSKTYVHAHNYLECKIMYRSVFRGVSLGQKPLKF